MLSPDETARSLLAQLGHPGARCVPARDGREHHLYRVDLPVGERLLKFPRRDALADPYDPTRPAEERLAAEAQAIALATDVPVPPVHQLHHTRPVCVTMGILPGTTAEIAYERGQLDEDGLIGVCLAMGGALGALHRRRRPPDGGGLPDLPGQDPSTARLLHLDYHLGNVLVRPQLGGTWVIAGVVDWTCARWGPPEADFVEMQVSVFALNPRARDAFIAGYRRVSARAVDVREVERRAVAEVRRRIVTEPPTDPELLARWRDWADRHE
jgi:aminoglycoside phosphotransferase (APT) family kinase protein